MNRNRVAVLLALTCTIGCGNGSENNTDAPTNSAQSNGAQNNARPNNAASNNDTTSGNARLPDAGAPDTGRADAGATDMGEPPTFVHHVVVANRGAGTLSVFDANTDELVSTVTLPDDGEPMYVTYDAARDRVFVGDRANNRVVAYDAADYEVAALIPVGEGVFHMWDSPDDGTLWVVNDVDRTLSVVNQAELAITFTVELPQDLLDEGGKPHDVFVDPDGSAVYTSIVGIAGKSVILKLDAADGRELARADVGGDAHLSAGADDFLYVPCQESSEVVVLRRSTLDEVETLDVPGAHGVVIAEDASRLYVVNLPGSGEMGLYTINLATREQEGAALQTPSDGVPHNVAISAAGKIYLTHSGATAERLSVIDLSTPSAPMVSDELTSGTNPFGLVAFSRETP